MSDFRPWKVLDLRLNEPLPSLAGKTDIEGYWAVFWWHDTPLGHLAIPSFQLPMTSASLAARASRAVAPSVGRLLVGQGFEPPLPVPRRKQHMQAPPKLASLLELDSPLSTLSHTARRAPSGQASIAVAVCTRERPAELARCLASLSALSPPPREIVVVDNAPTSDATRTVAKDVPGVRYVREPRAGLAVARNTAVGATTADILAFTDDDVTVAPDWIAGMQVAFADPEVLAVTGLILPAELETEAQYAFQLAGEKWGYRSVDFGPDFFATMRARGVPVWRIGAGANMAFRRRAFDLVGYFDERLGAGASGCSEDSEMWYRVLAEGHRCRYEPSAVVFHHHRSDWDSLSAQLHSYMRGHTVALLVQFERYRHWGNLYRIAAGIPAYYGRRALRQAVRGVLPQAVRRAKTASLPLTPQVRGYLSGVWYYLRHQEAGADLRSHAR